MLQIWRALSILDRIGEGGGGGNNATFRVVYSNFLVNPATD